MAAPGQRGGGIADISLFCRAAAVAGGAGGIVLGGVSENGQLFKHVHGSGSPGPPGAFNGVDQPEELGGEDRHADHDEKKSPASHGKTSLEAAAGIRGVVECLFDYIVYRTFVLVKGEIKKSRLRKVLLGYNFGGLYKSTLI